MIAIDCYPDAPGHRGVDTSVERVAAQPRTTELRLKGLIRDSGLRRPNRSGKKAIAWVAEVAHG